MYQNKFSQASPLIQCLHKNVHRCSTMWTFYTQAPWRLQEKKLYSSSLQHPALLFSLYKWVLPQLGNTSVPAITATAAESHRSLRAAITTFSHRERCHHGLNY